MEHRPNECQLSVLYQQHNDMYSLVFNILDISQDQNIANADESDTLHMKVMLQLCLDLT